MKNYNATNIISIILIIILGVLTCLLGGTLNTVKYSFNIIFCLFSCFIYIYLVSQKTRIKFPLINIFLILFVLLLILQTINLPVGFLRIIAGKNLIIKEKILEHLISYFNITFNLHKTIEGINSGIITILLIVIIYNFYQRFPKQIFLFINGFIIIGLLQAMLGIVQFIFKFKYLIFNYIRIDPISGTFISRNSYVSFLLLIFPLAFSSYLIGHNSFKKIKTFFFYSVSLIIFFSISLAGGRTGFLTLFIIQIILFTIFIFIFKVNLKNTVKKIIIFLLPLILIIITIYYIKPKITYRYANIYNSAVSKDNIRLNLWKDSMKVIKNHFLAGTGWGSFNNIIKVYQTKNTFRNFGNAENEYIELLIETGMVGFIFIITPIVFLTGIIIKNYFKIKYSTSIKYKLFFLAILTSLISIGTTSLTDFSLKIYSTYQFFIILTVFLIILFKNLIGYNNKNNSPIKKITLSTIKLNNKISVSIISILIIFVIITNYLKLKANLNFKKFSQNDNFHIKNNKILNAKYDFFINNIIKKDPFNIEYISYLAKRTSSINTTKYSKLISKGMNISPLDINLFYLAAKNSDSNQNINNLKFYLKKMTSIFPVNPNIYFNSANLFLKNNLVNESIENYKQTLTQSINRGHSYNRYYFKDYSEFYLTRILKNLLSKKLKFQTIEKILPEYNNYWYYHLGLTLMKNKNQDKKSLIAFLKALNYNYLDEKIYLLISKLNLKNSQILDANDIKNKIKRDLINIVIFSKKGNFKIAADLCIQLYQQHPEIIAHKIIPKNFNYKTFIDGIDNTHKKILKLFSLYEIKRISEALNLNIKFKKQSEYNIIAESCSNKFDKNYGYANIYIDNINYSKNSRGYNIVTINPITKKIKYRHFDTWKSSKDANDMADYLNSLPNRTFIIGAVKDNAFVHINSKLTAALAKIGIKNSIKDKKNYSHAFISIKGNNKKAIQDESGLCPIRLYLTK